MGQQMHGFVRLAMVWNRYLGLFLCSSIRAEKYEDLAAERACL